ncbi:MAG: hydroxyacid dehydrogenase [Gammaproteobacteria bacterium]|nr:hydroxyacid dehydrogenase [Gammaproteobacteria bacterium]
MPEPFHGSAPIVAAFELAGAPRDAFVEAVAGAAPVVVLSEVAEAERAEVLSAASAVFSRNPGRDLRDGELPLIAGARLLQCFSAGVDFIRLDMVPDSVPIACNAGAFAEPMAEHAVAMTLAAFKRLAIEQRALGSGEFNQFKRNKSVQGSVFGIFGFGGIGVATARLMRGLGAEVIAINRRGRTDEAVDFIGNESDLDYLLERSDALLLCAPYTTETAGIIGARELGLMKSDAALINLARGELIDEGALYAHLLANPEFVACIDAWWIEPVRHGEFRMDHPFLDLPNVIASPHNSASVSRIGAPPYRLAGENCRRAALGQQPLHLVDRALSPLLL